MSYNSSVPLNANPHTIHPYSVPIDLLATMPTPRLLEFAREFTKQTDDPTLSRSQRSYVRALLQPYLDAVNAELKRRGKG